MDARSIATLLDLSGQVAMVTGASRGIGRAIAELFHQAGAHIALLSRDGAALDALAATLNAARPGPASALALPTDVADENQVDDAVARTLQRWGRLDILVNNAGLIRFGPIERVAPDDWRRLLEVNLTGAYLCARAAAPSMRQQRHGRIINIASLSAQTGGVSGAVDYAASKGGMLAFTKTLARDLAADGITVNAIAPGQIDADPNLLTPEARARVTDLIPVGRLGEPVEIAYSALFLASPMAAYITGTTIDVNGGINKR